MAKRTTKNRTIEVILLQNDKYLGEKYEIVRVRPIFARNVLLPKGIAVFADAAAKNNYKQKMEAATATRAKKATNLEELFAKISADEGIEITRRANKDHTLYAKVDENDIADKIKEIYGIDVEPHFFKLKKKLTTAGTFNVVFAYNDLKREITVKIKGELSAKDAKAAEKAGENGTAESPEESEATEVKKTKEELKAEHEEKKAAEKAEKIAKLKEKYK
ncbi:MAG: 50S ribosomal protein L9 [Candidatus Peribacteria bacterium]|jgi:large subunit ribosomal protein L9|nr:50S ribosomal protein L9 [Candidatus Peribacteria bacterium]